jgi:hypothetical protein
MRPEGLISVNKVFKWLMLLFGFLFLVVFWSQSQNGRYVLQQSDQGVLLIDTRTGKVSWPKIPLPWSLR